ncbi:MAG: hypothetical protein ACRDZZ_06930 [Ilumatobacteraceae bacterium]
MVSGWADSNWLRVLGYGIAAAASLHAGLRERRRQSLAPGRDLWPAFWYLTAALLAVMAVGRAADIGGLVSEFGRREARAEGWYEVRREYQAAAVASVTAVWLIAVVVAIWRVPERRRRYLPVALVMFTLVCFAGVRIISLHHVDTLLYRRGVGGVRFVAIVELTGIALAILATYWYPFARNGVSRLDRPGPVAERA